jgi:hypothetical protein
MKYTCINIQGNFISEEVIQKVETASADFQKATDFGFEPGTNLRDEIEYSWSRVKLDWKHFSEKSDKLPASDQYGTTLGRKWMESFFTSIGFDLTKQKEALKGENNQTYTISHAATNNNGLPAQIVGFYDPLHPEKNTLDIKSSGGTSRLSPHGTVQEYLNVTEHIYGFATNGMLLRLIRDSGRLVKLTYIEFDIKRMLDEDKYSEFTILYRLIHSSRFNNDASIIEKYYQESIETGNRIRDGLSDAVKESMQALGNGFLQHPSNEALREKLKNKTITPKQYYDQLRRLVYRLLFLMVTEERDLIYDPNELKGDVINKKQIYLRYYSIARLRNLSENRYLYEKEFTDLWQGLLNTFFLFEATGNGNKIGIKPLDGDLFSETALKDINGAEIGNHVLLECIRNLNEFQDKETKMLVSINYRSLDVEELGSVYESLLELHPVIEHLDSLNPTNIHFTFHGGTERKTTGSYYTRPDLVNELIKSALIPVIEERVKEAGTEKKVQLNALLKLKVCDTAAGSGHMILAAARTIAWYMARIDSGEENPPPSIYRHWLRQAIQHCVYAVDLNPDAVELCKLALWLEGHNSGKPLSFLDHKIRCGNSLVGVADLSLLKKGIPDEAFGAVTGDDKAVCLSLKKANKDFNKTQQIKLDFDTTEIDFKEEQKNFAHEFAELDKIKQDTLEEVKMISKKHSEIKYNPKLQKDKNACDLYTAAFFYTYTKVDDPSAPSSQKLKSYLQSAGGVEARAIGMANVLSLENNYFHWPLEFPDVFEQGGFDVVLGNPPWERIKLQEEEFFSTKEPKIALVSNKSERKKMIAELIDNNPSLHDEFNFSKHNSEALGKFIRNCERYPLTSDGDINTYAIFAELVRNIINTKGACGVIVPTGIATDDSNKNYFGELIKKSNLISFYDFENKNGLFQDVDSHMRFSLITLSKGKTTSIPKFAFFLKDVSELAIDSRIIKIPIETFVLFNPNTLTTPSFWSATDLELAKKIYHSHSILENEISGKNEWKVHFNRMFDMSNDSKHFKSESPNLMRLYEAKMFQLYNHRFASSGQPKGERKIRGSSEHFESQQLENSEEISISRYYVEPDEVDKRVDSNHKWLMAYRNITSVVSNERSVIVSIIPRVGVGNSAPVILSDNTDPLLKSCLYGNFCSLIFDYLAQQKIGGVNFNYFIFKQIPVLSPSIYSELIKQRIVPKILELTYTAWDIKSYADDIWINSNDEYRNLYKKQWEENNDATGGHKSPPPNWSPINIDGFPLPPFKWNDERRALLRSELDAIYAMLYGLTLNELIFILDPKSVYGEAFPGETFRVMKEKESKQYGEYRTKRLVLEAWERLNRM